MGTVLSRDSRFISELVESIKHVIDFDINVVDETLTRIAGTGRYEEYVNLSLSEGCASDYVLKTGKAVIVYDPTENIVCKNCNMKKLCFKEHMIIYPIRSDNRIRGTVGIGAFDDVSKKKMRLKEQNLTTYLKNLCSLITARINETKYVDKLNRTINSVGDAVVLTNANGDIQFYNKKALNLLNLSNVVNIKSVFTNPRVNEIILNKERIKEYEIIVEGPKKSKRLYISTNPIIHGTKNDDHECVITIKDQSDLNETAYKLVSDTSYFEYGMDFILGNSDKINETKKLANVAAKGSSNVLIFGESGTGKELFARSIHQMGSRSNKPFIAINCAAIPDSLMESELFGYEEGAFTGAKKGGKPGKLELANGGTLFLDEVGDMSLHLQPKLLRVIEEGKFERVGGVKPISIDIRIIAATNRNLEDMINENKFREDLYYRLRVFPLTIPPLKERDNDILLLAEYFLELYSKKFNKNIKGFTSNTLYKLLAYNWPGNVRELENTIEFSVNIENTEVVTINSLPKSLNNGTEKSSVRSPSKLKDVEKELIIGAIRRHGETLEGKKKAAEELGISLSTLYRKSKQVFS